MWYNVYKYRICEVRTMKRWIAGIFVMVLLCCGGCAEKPVEEKVKMDDLMKISTWVMDPALEGKGYWAYDRDSYGTKGHWVPNKGEPAVNDEDVFREERLAVGETRIMAPIGYKGGNLNFTIDFEGIVTVEKTEPADHSILTSFEPNLADQWIEETLITRNGPCNLNVFPVGKNLASEGRGLLIQHNTIAEKEYLLTIKGYELDGSLMVTAELKLTTLEDEAFPYEEYIQETYRRTGGYAGYGELYAVGENRTRFCSVELVSYEYSDHYKMMEIFG